MGPKSVLLINPNRMRPPIGPLGLEYVASDLARRGYDPVMCDLAFADDWSAMLDDAIAQTAPFAIGVSVRNIDDAYFASQDFVLEATAAVVRTAVMQSNAPVVLGGVGFSTAPREVLGYTGADYGIVGDGEIAFAALLDCLQAGRGVSGVPGAVFRADDGRIVARPPRPAALATVPGSNRAFADNVRYYREGGQSGLETKRGCDRQCIYCTEPQSKGPTLRLRSPQSVADEVVALVDQGIETAHLCDSEFNLPREHAYAVCEELTRRELNDRFRWYTYAAVDLFDEDLAKTMARAGCAGIDFGVDHADETMLRRLGRGYGPDQIRRVAEACRNVGIPIMFDTLLGGPGETRDTLCRAIEFMRRVRPDRVGLSCGVRVYPHTPLAELVRDQGPPATNPNLHGAVVDNDAFLRPIFFVDQAIGADIRDFVWTLVQDDERFFAADPNEKGRDYNYNDNSVLADAIRRGARGAYWDILRRQADHSPG